MKTKKILQRHREVEETFKKSDLCGKPKGERLLKGSSKFRRGKGRVEVLSGLARQGDPRGEGGGGGRQQGQ